MKRTPVALALFVLAALGCVDREAQVQAKQTEALIKDPTTAVTVMQVEPVTVEDTLDMTGSIETSDDVNVTAIVGGPIVAVFVKPQTTSLWKQRQAAIAD